tara:strand:+ start:7716 stop:8042 length:327 start_codon:yes stop_codon:yes gene_type:complete
MLSYTQTMGGDSLDNLPTDKTEPSHDEMEIINTLFEEHKNSIDLIVEESKDSVLIALLFVIFSLDQVDSFIKRAIPITEKSPYILVGVKTVIFVSTFWLVNHFYLSRQ